MELANDLYNYDRLHLQQSGRSFEIRNKIIKTVIQNDMITLYKTLCSKYNWDFDDEVAGSMR